MSISYHWSALSKCIFRFIIFIQQVMPVSVHGFFSKVWKNMMLRVNVSFCTFQRFLRKEFCQPKQVLRGPSTADEIAIWRVDSTDPFVETPQAWVTSLTDLRVSSMVSYYLVCVCVLKTWGEDYQQRRLCKRFLKWLLSWVRAVPAYIYLPTTFASPWAALKTFIFIFFYGIASPKNCREYTANLEW